jgi:phosphoribosylformylglycinamidine (FGAM) synthase-like amidotransferase family enzyme
MCCSVGFKYDGEHVQANERDQKNVDGSSKSIAAIAF